MNDENSCMLQEITSFLIKVGEHCLSCEGKTIASEESDTIIFKSKPKPKAETLDDTPIEPEKPVHNVKKSYLEKWIRQNNFTTFTLEQFYNAYPKQRKNENLTHNISKLINDGKILQWGKTKFTVV